MKRNIFLLSLVLCFLLLTFSRDGIAGTLQEVKERGKLIVGVKTDYPPLGFLDENGVNRGFDIDIAKGLAKELFGNKEAVQFVPVTSGNRIALLTSRKIDIIVATFTITEERKRKVDFSIPYFITGQLILVRGDSKITKTKTYLERRWQLYKAQPVILPSGSSSHPRNELDLNVILKRSKP